MLWNIANFSIVNQLSIRDTTSGITSLAFSPDGKLFVSGINNGTVVFWDTTSGEIIGQPLTGSGGDISDLAFSPDGKLLASGSTNGNIILWNVGTREPIGDALKGYTGQIYAIDISPDGRTLSSATDNGIVLWDLTGEETGGSYKIDNTLMRSVAVNKEPTIPSVLAVSPDGKTLAYENQDETITLWDVVNTKTLGPPLIGYHYVEHATFSPDGKVFAVSGSDFTSDTISLWEVPSGKPIGQPFKYSAICLEFSPDSGTLALGNFDGTIFLWSFKHGNSVGKSLIGNKYQVIQMAFSADGKILASASADKNITLWDIANLKPIGLPLIGNVDSVSSLAFSPDGKMFASGSQDASIILWDIASGKAIGQPILGNTYVVSGLAFSKDGKILTSKTYDGTTILWDLDPLSWLEKTCQRGGRNFTQSEWQQYFPNEIYRITCPQWLAGQ